MDLIFVIPRCAIAHRGCADRTRVYPSSAISLSKSATADLDAQARNPYSLSWLWIPGSLASQSPRNDGAQIALSSLKIKALTVHATAPDARNCRIAASS